MYEVVFSSTVSNGMVMGYRCPISDQMFVGFDPSKSTLEQLRVTQTAATRALMQALDDGPPQVTRPLASYQDQYRALRLSSPYLFRADGFSFKTPAELLSEQS